ncbi:uncharacterized protein LOC132923242 isoform X2 [Rhopalosiphum padi]|uniref:uncharacterized protein LOC132923242 isoform X2 n=1 Tax=Rhopalosiphum padi TaxID=40932 RepID=UPI00298E458C|nr:uncharacterized protein LOC132923242 isoform X2 [Rhopalosiphum padi]
MISYNVFITLSLVTVISIINFSDAENEEALKGSQFGNKSEEFINSEQILRGWKPINDDIYIRFFNDIKQQKCDKLDPPKSPYQYCSDLDAVAKNLTVIEWCKQQFNPSIENQ